jgi:hypothetical protein
MVVYVFEKEKNKQQQQYHHLVHNFTQEKYSREDKNGKLKTLLFYDYSRALPLFCVHLVDLYSVLG